MLYCYSGDEMYYYYDLAYSYYSGEWFLFLYMIIFFGAASFAESKGKQRLKRVFYACAVAPLIIFMIGYIAIFCYGIFSGMLKLLFQW